LEQHGDDEDLFANWGGAPRPIGHELRNSQASIRTITPGNTQVLAGLVTPDGEHLPQYILAKIVSHLWFSPVRLQS